MWKCGVRKVEIKCRMWRNDELRLECAEISGKDKLLKISTFLVKKTNVNMEM